MKNKLRLLGVVISATMALAVQEAGASVAYTPWQTAFTSIKNTGTSGNTILSFNQFDSSLGTLHDVEFQLDANAYVAYRYRDLSGSSNTFQFVSSVTVRIQDPTDPLANLVVAIPGVSDIQRTVAAGATYATPGYPNPLVSGLSGSNTSGLIDCSGPCLTPALAAYFTGPGTIGLLSGAAIAFNFNGTNDASTTVISRWDGTLQVRYSYEEPPPPPGLPEPATLFLFSAGLFGIAARRKLSA